MARITKLQKTIFDNHIKAFNDKSFSDKDEFKTVEDFKEKLPKGFTSEAIWNKLIGLNLSMTGSILLGLGHISNNAMADLRKSFKTILNHLNIV